MIKETITYVNCDGEEETTDLYFNMSKVAFAEMSGTKLAEDIAEVGEMSQTGTVDAAKVLDVVKRLVSYTYGRRVTDADGTHPRFVRKKEWSDEFVESDIYDAFIDRFLTEPARMEAFILNIIPSDMREEVQKELDNSKPAITK